MISPLMPSLPFLRKQEPTGKEVQLVTMGSISVFPNINSKQEQRQMSIAIHSFRVFFRHRTS
ncbi:MAG: hypothetical protein B6245_13515 [Desulfobacteraceae bacterium 4572_88]|nr:MAG: hypothetical protein B6245_13515 [Desulfobacteraceae bacterium 4572_88]